MSWKCLPVENDSELYQCIASTNFDIDLNSEVSTFLEWL